MTLDGTGSRERLEKLYLAEAMTDRHERVILVDASDAAIGTAGKLEAHLRGDLHRAFSVFIMNSLGEILLQRRAATKYHGGGLWSNSCCGHPRPGEATSDAARRRLREELGIDCELTPLFSFTYRAEMDRGLIEHEIDHVFAGRFDGEPHPDADEVDGWRWAAADAIRAELASAADSFTPWFEPALNGALRGGTASGEPG